MDDHQNNSVGKADEREKAAERPAPTRTGDRREFDPNGDSAAYKPGLARESSPSGVEDEPTNRDEYRARGKIETTKTANSANVENDLVRVLEQQARYVHGVTGSTTRTAMVANARHQPQAATALPSAEDLVLGAGNRVGQYEIIRRLGRGGMGTVFLARDVRLGRLVAIKFLLERREHLVRRFMAEAQVTAQCIHENIVVIHDIGSLRGFPYMVLEYLHGMTLGEWMKLRAFRRSASGVKRRAISVAQAVEIMAPAVRALIKAHGLGIVHRDLKPSNIILTDTGVTKVLDFGIAKFLGIEGEDGEMAGLGPTGQGVTSAGAIVGTRLYMSPEQWRGDEVDHRCDLWAVGMILYELVTGINPVAGGKLHPVRDLDVPMPSVRSVRSDLGKLGLIIDRCLIKDKADRVDDARTLLSELEELLPTKQASRIGTLHRDGHNPYAGLSAFQESDAERFFGRESDVRGFLAKLRDHPLLAIVGPSGVGKSSFVRAGVIPALNRSGEVWKALVMRPGRSPMASLAELLLQLPWSASGSGSGVGTESSELAIERDRDKLIETFYSEPGFFGARLRARARRKLYRIAIFIDQLEEVYTLAQGREREAFFACLEGAADDAGSPLRVLVSMRSDFLDRMAQDREIMRRLSRGLVFLPPIGRKGLRQALIRPLELAEYRFEDDGMVVDMLDTLEQARTPLPLLQFTAATLWDQRDQNRRIISAETYRAVGGVTGTLSSHADTVVANMPARQRSLVREMFLRLVTPERTRALASVSELCELSPTAGEIEDVVNQLVDARLLAVEADEDENRVVEIVHESLIDSWPTLGRWLDENQEDAELLDRLRSAAKQWRASGRRSGLLWRDEAMRDAEHWYRRYRGELATSEKEYLEAVFALAERSQRRRRRWYSGASAILLTIALVMSYLAWSQARASKLAQRQADRAQRAGDRARLEARRTRDAMRIVRAREWARDPTFALSVLREVEDRENTQSWMAQAMAVSRSLVARAVMQGHEDVVQRVSFSPDGRYIATVSHDKTARVWRADGTGAPTILRGHDDRVTHSSFSRDGRHAVTASHDGTARIWKLDGSGEPAVFAGHQGPVRWAELSRDGTRLVTASNDGTVRVWSATDPTSYVVLAGHTRGVWVARFSPDGTRVLSASEDGTARLWRADGTGQPVILAGHEGPVRGAEFSPNGHYVVTSSHDKTARVWPARRRSCAGTRIGSSRCGSARMASAS